MKTHNEGIIKTRVITAIPLVLVNTVALTGQVGFIRDHTSLPVTGALVFAGAIESVALYLAYMAHVSMMALDSSLRLRLGAYGFGLLAGAMNYSHYAHGYRPTFLAAATGIMSALSPVLWGIYSRRQSRDKMRDLGLIEPGAVRLGFNRWLMFPARSFKVYRHAAWQAIREPADAITAWETRPQPQPQPQPQPEPEPQPEALPEPVSQRSVTARQPRHAITGVPVTGAPDSKTGTVQAAYGALGSNATAPDVVSWCAAQGVTVTAGHVRQIKSRTMQRASVRAFGNGHFMDITVESGQEN